MDWWLKTGTMKRKLNEKAPDTDSRRRCNGEMVQPQLASSRRGAAFKQRFFLPLRRQQDDNYILCCVTLDHLQILIMKS